MKLMKIDLDTAQKFALKDSLRSKRREDDKVLFGKISKNLKHYGNSIDHIYPLLDPDLS